MNLDWTKLMPYSQIPNLLTLFRILACPVLVLLLSERHYDAALAVFVLAGITDGLDGFIAKRFNYVTSLGSLLDPIADKLLIACSYAMLAILGDIPFWLLVVVMFRDIVIIAGYLILVTMEREVPMNPTYSSKLNTFMQICLVVAILVQQSELMGVSPLIILLIFGVSLTTVISGIQYVWYWAIRHDLETGS